MKWQVGEGGSGTGNVVWWGKGQEKLTRGQGFQKCRCVQEEKVMQGREVEGTSRALGKIYGMGWGAELVTWWRKGQEKTYKRARFQKYICVQEENSGMPVFRQKPEFRPWQFIFMPYVSVVLCTNCTILDSLQAHSCFLTGNPGELGYWKGEKLK